MSRREAIGKRREYVRYFEIEKGGCPTLEKRQHEHAAIVSRAKGQARTGGNTSDLGLGDGVNVCPNDPHPFVILDHHEPFGFSCVGNAQRGRPELVGGMGFCKICE